MKKAILLAAATPLLFVSCAQKSLTGDVYSRHEAGRLQSVHSGRITAIRPVQIQGETEAGSFIGSIAGGFLGSEIGSGRTSSIIGSLAGAGLGSIAGSHTQKNLGTKQGIEITVKLDSGRTVSTVQEVNPRETFRRGERVRVLSNGNKTRITH